MAASSTFYTTAVTAHRIVTDLTVCFCPIVSPCTCKLDPRRWHRIEKDLYLYRSQQSAWLYVAIADEAELVLEEDMLVVNICVRERPPDPGSDYSWESRPGGIWVQRCKFSGKIDQAVTEVDVLFGVDAVDPRPQWDLMKSSLHLDADPEVPVARLTVLYGTPEPRPDRAPLRVGPQGKFKIILISDTHMGTDELCRDAIDANGKKRPESKADILTIAFIERILDIEQPDLVILLGDQLHHDTTYDSLTTIFRLLDPIIKRAIRFAVVFGNHDDEDKHALSRTNQMSIYQHLPYSHCEPGPEDVDGIGNFYLQVLAPAPSQLPLSTLYFLDSHGQKPSMIGSDYEHIKQSQIRWFTRTSQALQRAREKNDYTNLFYLPISLQHIPVPELGDSYLRICKGHRGEPTEGPRYNSNFYKALAKEGILAFFCGHDHVNNFCGLLPRQTQEDGGKTPQPGPWLCYAGCSGFGGYCTYDEKTFHRQMRVLELDTTGSLTTWMRVAYKEGIFDQVVLVESGAVIDLPEEEYKEAV